MVTSINRKYIKRAKNNNGTKQKKEQKEGASIIYLMIFTLR